MRRSIKTFFLGLVIASTACTASFANPPAPADIDWAKAPSAELRLSLGFFRPGEIDLAKGQPVRLIFVNGDGRTHDFVTRLFTAVTQRQGQRQGGVRVILQAMDKVEYDIIPLQDGIYTVTSVMYVQQGRIAPAKIIVK